MTETPMTGAEKVRDDVISMHPAAFHALFKKMTGEERLAVLALLETEDAP